MDRGPKFIGTIAYSEKPVAGLTLYEARRPKTLEEEIEELDRSDIAETRRRELLTKIKTRAVEAEQRLRDLEGNRSGDKNIKAEVTKPKRYNVVEGNPFPIEDEDGQYTFSQAATLLAIQNRSKGGDTGAIELAKALKELKPEEKTTALEIITTMSDKFGRGDDKDKLTTKDLELLKVEQAREQDRIRGEFKDMVTDVVARIPQPKGLLDQVNDLIGQYNKLPEFITKRIESFFSGGGPSYKDEKGNVLPLPHFLELKRFELEEGRKDESVKQRRDVINLAKQHAPTAIEALRNLGKKGKKTEEEKQLETTGWKPREGEAGPKMIEGVCGKCGGKIPYSEGAKLVKCPSCGEDNFFGTAEELEAWEKALSKLKEAPKVEAESKEPKVEAYCMKCRAKREMKDPEPIIMKNGRAATQGVCPVCGTKMFKIVKKQESEKVSEPV